MYSETSKMIKICFLSENDPEKRQLLELKREVKRSKKWKILARKMF